MSIKYPKNVIVGVSIVAALLGATVLLGGYANIKPAVTDSQAPVKACQASGSFCPAMAQPASQAMAAAQMVSTDHSGKPCTTVCPKPCCADDAPKGCCGASEPTECPMSAAENNIQ